MSRLVKQDRVEVEPPAAEIVVRVDQDVAAPGARERGIVGNRDRKRIGRHRLGADADVAELRVMLRRPRGAKGLAAIAHQADVDVRLDGPGLEGLKDLPLPVSGRLLGVERLEQRAALAGDRRSVRGEAQC